MDIYVALQNLCVVKEIVLLHAVLMKPAAMESVKIFKTIPRIVEDVGFHALMKVAVDVWMGLVNRVVVLMRIVVPVDALTTQNVPSVARIYYVARNKKHVVKVSMRV